MNPFPNDWTGCEVYRGWAIACKTYRGEPFYKGFRAGAQTASYASRADARLAIDATEEAFA